MNYTYLVLFCLLVFNLQAQQPHLEKKDSTTKESVLKSSIIPLTLMTSGILINNSKFEKKLQSDIRTKVGNDFEFPIDDYLQFVPVVQLYLADAFQVEAKNHWFDQSKYLFISNLITAAITQTLKRITLKTRPDGSSPYSFPSGHTSFAFTNAAVLMQEFKDTAPVLAYSGYLFSTTTAAFRVINNRHYLSDVLAGAGIAMLVTELVYWWEPLKNVNPFLNSKNISLVPVINHANKGIYISVRF